MTIRETLKEKNMSVYRLAKESRIPYATVNDICTGKASLEKCSGETIYKLAKALELSMEELLTPCLLERSRLKELGDLNFIMDTLESGDIRMYYEKKWYPESLYLLAMLDYISRENHIALDREFDDIRQCKLEIVLYPLSLQAMSLAVGKQDMQKEAEKSAIPEFLRFNIIESDVRNVI